MDVVRQLIIPADVIAIIMIKRLRMMRDDCYKHKKQMYIEHDKAVIATGISQGTIYVSSYDDKYYFLKKGCWFPRQDIIETIPTWTEKWHRQTSQKEQYWKRWRKRKARKQKYCDDDEIY